MPHLTKGTDAVTPPDPHYADPMSQAMAALAAPFAAVKPAFWFAGMVAATMLWGNALLNRLARVEEGVHILTVMQCRETPDDTLCERVKR